MVPEKIKTVFYEKINPSLSAHRGFAEPLSYDNGVLTIRMGGACRGCLSQDSTINGLIKTMLSNHCGDYPVSDVVVSDEIDPSMMALAKQILGTGK